MSDNGDMRRNVGTQAWPVSELHGRAVALLYDELTRKDSKYRGEVRARLSPGGELSHDLRAGVTTVKVPDPEWESVGGIVPDLILYGEDDAKPLRIIEVVVTSPPSKEKCEKLDGLRKRGVDVVMITVKEEADLLRLCPTSWEPKFASQTRHRGLDSSIDILMSEIQGCSPSTRRAFVKLLSELNTLDSLYPITPTNPLKEKFNRGAVID